MREPKSQSPWWSWWVKWWILAAAGVFLILILSEPPQMWFWLVMFIALILYATERAVNG